MMIEYSGIKRELYKRYMDDLAGAASCSEQDLTQFLTFASNFHPKLEYIWSISLVKLPFLDMYLMPRGDRISTSIYYEETDSRSYLNFKSSHPFICKSAIPYSQFLRLRKICSEDDDFEESANSMETFFVAHGYPIHLVRDGRQKATSTPRANLLTGRDAHNRTTATNRVPIVTTYNPKNTSVCSIL